MKTHDFTTALGQRARFRTFSVIPRSSVAREDGPMRLLFIFLSFICVAFAGPAPASQKVAVTNFNALPLSFEAPRSASSSRYVARGQGYLISIDGPEVLIGVQPSKNAPGQSIGMQFRGGRRPLGVPEGQLPGKVNYFIGKDPRKWDVGLPTFERVRYRDVYPGVDVVYYGNRQHLEFDFDIKPGAKPDSIRLKFEGAEKVSLNDAGAIVLETPAGELRLPPPVVYQEIAEHRLSVPGTYRKLADGDIAFSVGRFDSSKDLIVDPTIVYSTFLGGGTESTYPQAIAVSSNNAYITGYTFASDFPVTPGAFSGYHGGADGFVTQMNSTGTALVCSTYFGGSGDDSFYGIAVDGSGAAWVAGYTDSTDFPTMNPYQAGLAGSFDVAVVKLSASGVLLFSTYLGGVNYEYGSAIALDPQGNAYVTGYASTGFPTTTGVIAAANQGANDAFVTKFSSTGALVYSTYLGGAATDFGYAIAADSNGNAYVAGATFSNLGFRGAPGGGAQQNYVNNGDAFVAKLNPAATAMLYFTYLGGSQYDQANSIAVDSMGNAYVAGQTSSLDFPTTQGAFQTTLNGGTNGFVAKLNVNGSVFSYETYIGSNRTDTLRGMALDPNGNVYLAGDTNGDQFPSVNALEDTLPGPSPNSLYQTTNSGAAWTAFDSGLRGTVNSLSPDPASSTTLVASTDIGLFKTTDGGTTWTLENSTGLVFFSRSPVVTNTIYGVNASSAYKSLDGGSTWNRAGSLGQCCGTVVVADPLTANTAYVFGQSANFGVVKTTDGGATWNLVNSGLPSLVIQSMAAASDGSLYLALVSNGVYKSTNQGASWTSMSNGLPAAFSPIAIAASASNAAVLYVCNSYTVYKTTNGGANWAATSATVPNGSIISIGVSPLDSQIVYASSAFSPVVYNSPDGGTTWNSAASGLGNAPLYQFVFSPQNSGQVFGLAAVTTTAWLAKMNTTGTALVYSTFLGGSKGSYFGTVATNGTGDAFVTGYTYSPDFPVSPGAYSTAYPGNGQAFLTRVSDTTGSCSYAVNPGNQLIYGSQQSIVYSVVAASGCVWSASSDQNWATITGGVSGSGAGSVAVQAASNTGSVTRTANLTIAGQTVVLSQASNQCSYALSYNSLVAAAGGAVAVQLTTPATCGWTVFNEAPAAVSASPASGTGPATINLTVSANQNPNSRGLSLLIGNQPLILNQSGQCSFSVTPPGPALWSGGQAVIQVLTNSGCLWTSSSNVSWATVSGPAGTTGSGFVIFSLTANPAGPGPRTGTVTVAGQTITLTEEPPATSAGFFRQGFLWVLDVDGNQRQNIPPDLVYAFGGIPGDIPITGDWNGNGHTKVGIYRPSNGLFILDTNGNGVIDAGDAVFNLHIGTAAGDVPVVGDWNGDGRSKVGYFRQGFLWILDTNGNHTYDQSDQVYAFGGIPGDVPVVGDWTGTGTSKIGIFRQGFLWILDANGNGSMDGTGTDFVFAYGGIPGDVPVVGDWTGTGITQVGIFRQGFLWALDANGDRKIDAGDFVFGYGGIPGDKPVTGRW